MTEPGSVGRRTARAAVWGFAATAASKGVTLVALALLARLLAPREFGLLAFAMAYIAYAETIGDLGSGLALIYWPDRRDDAAQITFLVNAAAGIFWCLATLAIAPLVAEFFKTPAGAPIVRALAFSFPLKYLGTAHDALAQKDLRFRARAVPEFAFAAVKAAVALVLAWLGFGAWSLVWGHLAGLTTWTLFLWIVVPWRPTWSFPRDLLRPMLTYGRSMMAVNVLHGVAADADLAFVGRFLGVTALGLYQMATRITETGVSVVLRVVSKVVFPAFAQVHGSGESLRRPFLFTSRLYPAVAMAPAIGIAVMARPIVLAALGPKWEAAAPILAILGLYMGAAALPSHAGDVLKASGRAHLLARWSVARAVLVLMGLYVAAQISATAVAASLLIANSLSSAILIVMACRLIEVPLSSVVKALMPALVSSAVMAAAVMAWLRAIAGWDAWPQLISGVAVGAAVYIVTLRFADPEIFRWTARAVLPRRFAGAGDSELPEAQRPGGGAPRDSEESSAGAVGGGGPHARAIAIAMKAGRAPGEGT